MEAIEGSPGLRAAQGLTPLEAATVATPAGPISVLVAAGAVVAAGFTGDAGDLRGRLAPELRDAPLRGGAAAAAAALAAYVDGDLRAPAAVTVRGAGTAYHQRAWAALRDVPPGAPVTYGELAARTGSPAGARAAGSACARNPAAVFVPCHRVVRGDGALGGFAWGLDAKRWLLDHERRHAGLGGSVLSRPR